MLVARRPLCRGGVDFINVFFMLYSGHFFSIEHAWIMRESGVRNLLLRDQFGWKKRRDHASTAKNEKDTSRFAGPGSDS